MWKQAGLKISLSLGLVGLLLGPAVAQNNKEVLIGLQCDRTGATQNVGTVLCPAYHDYVALVNSKGGVEGYKIKVEEIDNEYKVPPAMEAHERFKKDGAVLDGVYGTPQIAALNTKLAEDKILGTSPGFGTAAAADGKKFPYTFPIAASYWSQGAAAVKFAKDKLGGSLKGKKIAYLYYDNPAGTEPIAVIEDLAKTEGFELRTFAVPPPGLEMAAQVLDITGPLPTGLHHHPSVRPLALGLDQGAQGQGLSAEQGSGAGVGCCRSRHRGGRRLRRCRGLQCHAIRRRRQRLPGDQRDQRHVQGARQGATEGASGLGDL